jgi:hypothetical protein
MVALCVTLVHDTLSTSNHAATAPSIVSLVALATLPWAFVVGLVRTRFSRANAVGDFVERLNATGVVGESLRDALADALGDRSLALAYWSRSSERYVDSQGRRAARAR